jgi:YaiO family outer membrane protein
MNTLSRVYLCAMLVCTGTSTFAQTGLRSPAPADASLGTLRLDNARPQYRPGSPLAPKGEYAYATPDPAAGDVSAGVYQPLSTRLSTLLETTHSSGPGLHQEKSMLGEVSASFGEGWGVRAGVRHSELGLQEFPLHAPLAGTTSSDVGMVTLERSWDRYRGAYTYYAGRSETGTLASGHRLQLHYFYGERSSVGLAYTIGQPMDPLAAPNALGMFDMSNVGVTGEHWLSDAWSLKYDALMEDAGSQGLKPELRLGLRLRF